MISNTAFVFIKPHAVNEKVKELVKERFASKGIVIQKEGQIDAETIDHGMLLDQHYYGAASKATILKPEHMPVPEKEFASKFGKEWADVLRAGKAFNAKDACIELGLDAAGIARLWAEAETSNQIVKFDRGFYCAKIRHVYVFNAFFMEMRNRFVEAGASIYYYVVEWSSLDLSWEDFRDKFIGAESSPSAPAESLRGTLFSNWEQFDLCEAPTTSNNGVHASASAFEGLVERMNWLGVRAQDDSFGTILLENGITAEKINEWSVDPQIELDGNVSSIFDTLEDLDADQCLVQCQYAAGIKDRVRNSAFVDIAKATLLETSQAALAQPVEANAPDPLVQKKSGHRLVGHLWKRTPSSCRLWKYQWRKIILEDGKLSWAEPGDNHKEIKGVVDFSANRCVVAPLDGDPAKFIIRPEGGMWTMGNFTGADKGREFTFDITDSEYGRTLWMNAIKKQMQVRSPANSTRTFSFFPVGRIIGFC